MLPYTVSNNASEETSRHVAASTDLSLDSCRATRYRRQMTDASPVVMPDFALEDREQAEHMVALMVSTVILQSLQFASQYHG